MTKPVNFRCYAPEASQVHLTGDFNNWDPQSNPMFRSPDGAWCVQMQLHHGHHQYRFIIDGKPALDPQANGVARDPKGEKASLIAVS